MLVDNLSLIAQALPKYPEIMKEDSGEKLIKIHQTLIETDNEIQELREKLRIAEARQQELKQTYNKLCELFDISYAKKEIGDKPTDNTMTGDVIQRARNQH